MDEEGIRLILEENDSDSNYDDENDSDFEDHVEIEAEKSDTEQDGDSESEDDQRTFSDFYLGKDNETKWNKTAPSNVKKNPNHKSNGIKMLQFDRERDCTPTDEIEIQAFLGLLLFAGVRRKSRLNAKGLFKTDGSSPEIFRLTMSWNRFYLLLRCLRFDDKDTRDVRNSVDKLAPIRDFFDHPKHPEGPYSQDKSSLALVLRLSDIIHNTGRNITLDNFFTNLPLIDKLEQEYRLTIIGTIRKNKKELPKEFTEIRGRMEKSSLFGYRGNCTLVTYVPQRNKNVLLVYSMHDNGIIDENTQKPEIIMESMDYNATKGGVDTVDKMCETYNVARGTNRWPMVILYSLMNVAGINSYVIYVHNNPNKKLIVDHFWKLYHMIS